MKKLVGLWVGALAFAATTPVLAGPNWEIIEQARKDAKVRHAMPGQKMTHAQMMKACRELHHRK